MTVDSIKNGVVIDHIAAGHGMMLYRYLDLDRLTCPVALIKNAVSAQLGKKDIIKIDGMPDMNLEIVGYLAPGSTINVIRDGAIIRKWHPPLPEQVTGVIHCKNPRCITSTEPELPHVFRLTDRENRVYRCVYCDTRAKNSL